MINISFSFDLSSYIKWIFFMWDTTRCRCDWHYREQLPSMKQISCRHLATSHRLTALNYKSHFRQSITRFLVQLYFTPRSIPCHSYCGNPTSSLHFCTEVDKLFSDSCPDGFQNKQTLQFLKAEFQSQLDSPHRSQVIVITKILFT